MMQRTNYYSYLRAMACLAIVLLHTVESSVLMYDGQISVMARTVSKSVVYCMMWAVPSFVMVTGALLLDPNREISLKKLYGKYVLRIVLALFFCALVFRIFDLGMNHEAFTVGSVLTGLWNAVIGKSWAHLWYLYLIIGIYLLLPAYRKISAHSSDREIRYLLGIYALFLSVLPLTKMFGVETAFYIHVSTIYPFYLFLGWAIAAEKIRISRGNARILLLLGILGIVSTTVLRYHGGRENMQALLNYSSFYIIMMCMGILPLLKAAEGREGIGSKILLAIDNCSFGIYLIHMIFLRLILRYWEVDPYSYGWWMMILIWLGVFLVSWGIVAGLKKIPGLKKIL